MSTDLFRGVQTFFVSYFRYVIDLAELGTDTDRATSFYLTAPHSNNSNCRAFFLSILGS